MKKGLYVAFEGMTGVGKSVQSKLLFKKLKKRFPQKKVVWTIEPGGSEIASAIRNVVQRTLFRERMDPVCEAYLYAASRAQTLRKLVEPVLNDGGILVADRSVFTSLVFQGLGRELGMDKVLEINREAVGEIWPNAVVVLDVDPGEARGRSFDVAGDKFERMGISWYRRVRRGYLEVA